MRPRIAIEPLTDCFRALGAHDQKDVWRALQRAAKNDDTFLREPIHEIGMLSPLWLAF